MLTDPRPALAEQSNFVGYLVGLASLARAVHALAGHPRTDALREADDFAYLLLGLASVGDAINRLAEFEPAQPSGTTEAPASHPVNARWLR